MDTKVVGVGVVGCGSISERYLGNAARFGKFLKVLAVSDIDKKAAEAKAEKHNIPVACGYREMLRMDDVELVLNLAVPGVHASLNMAAIRAGKHVYSEKPLALNRRRGAGLLEAARAAGVRVGCAPDTVLGAGQQTARRLIDSGAIGRPVAAAAFFMSRGPEAWHRNPEFFYKPGGGPMFDMGPYYLTALVSLLGPVERAAGFSGVQETPRVTGAGLKRGRAIEVETPDHVAGTLMFRCGAIGSIITSFASWGADLPCIEVYGTKGSLSAPDPNIFGGAVKLLPAGRREWIEAPLTGAYCDNSRMLGVADMARGIRTGRPHRASGELACHVLDVMQTLAESGREGRPRKIASACQRPAPMPAELQEGQLD